MDDFGLLRDYAERGSEQAFAELVRRHVDLVYSTAWRLVGEAALAQDVTQLVFIQLARKPGSLRHGTIVAGWLYRTTRFVAQTVRRSDARRRQRESMAMEMSLLDQQSESVWKEVSPLLEEAMAGLRATDQNAVLLRFFAGKSLREVGEALGISDDAAQKRVDRALGRLRDYFAGRGVAVSAVLLTTLLAQNAVQAAPLAVTAALATTAVATGTGTSVGVSTWELFKVMAFAKLKSSGIGAAILLLATTAAVLELLPDSTTTAQAAANKAPEAMTLRGTVRLLDGKPLSNALVRVATPDAYVRLYEWTNSGARLASNTPSRTNVAASARSSPWGQPWMATRTAADGSFTIGLPALPREGKAVVVVCDDAGYAITTADALAGNPELVVHDWARIEGVLRIGEMVASNATVNIGIWGSSPIYEWNLVPHGLSTKTDANGRFVFPRVAPTDVWLTHSVAVAPGESRQNGHHYLKLGAGDRATVQLGGRGRVVTGRIEWAGEEKLPFHGSMYVNQKFYMRNPPGWQAMSAEEKRQYELEWRETPDGDAFKREVRNYEFPVQADGTFRVPDVLPGSYRLQVRADKRAVAGQPRVTVVSREIKVLVPDPADGEAIDVGTVYPEQR